MFFRKQKKRLPSKESPGQFMRFTVMSFTRFSGYGESLRKSEKCPCFPVAAADERNNYLLFVFQIVFLIYWNKKRCKAHISLYNLAMNRFSPLGRTVNMRTYILACNYFLCCERSQRRLQLQLSSLLLKNSYCPFQILPISIHVQTAMPFISSSTITRIFCR
jgi:hypothetical protein